MYEFKILKSLYTINIQYQLPDYTVSEYSSKVMLRAKRHKKGYLFTLEEKRDVMIDEEAPQKVMDFLMAELGCCLYPIEMEVSPTGEIVSIMNFDNIKERWEAKVAELLNKYRTDAFEKYLEMSRVNFSNEDKFKLVIQRDTFIQLFFLLGETKNILEIECINFPLQNRKTTYYGVKDHDDEEQYGLLPAFKENDVEDVGGELNYKTAKTGELLEAIIDFYLVTTDLEKYEKTVKIFADKSIHRVKTGFFF